MELKEYQQGVLEKFEYYLRVLDEQRAKHDKVLKMVKEEAIDFDPGDWCEKTWKQLNEERRLPYLYDAQGNALIAPYIPRLDGLKRPIPNVCFKVPTGGGKTLLGDRKSVV